MQYPLAACAPQLDKNHMEPPNDCRHCYWWWFGLSLWYPIVHLFMYLNMSSHHSVNFFQKAAPSGWKVINFGIIGSNFKFSMQAKCNFLWHEKQCYPEPKHESYYVLTFLHWWADEQSCELVNSPFRHQVGLR
jgi:hypothetical protein